MAYRKRPIIKAIKYLTVKFFAVSPEEKKPVYLTTKVFKDLEGDKLAEHIQIKYPHLIVKRIISVIHHTERRKIHPTVFYKNSILLQIKRKEENENGKEGNQNSTG